MQSLNGQLNQAFELFDKGLLNEAETLYKDCIEKINDTNSNEYVQALHGLGYVKAALNKYEEARSYYKKLIHIALNNSEKMAHVQLFIERMASCYDEALNLFQLEGKLLQKYDIESPINLSANYYEQGYLALLKGNLVLAEQLMNKSLQLALKAEDDVCIGCAYRGIGKIYNAKGEKDLAKQSHQNAREAFTRANDDIAVQEIDELL